MKTIVCYGDSNTWGYVPMVDGSEAAPERYSYGVRWPGVLARLLGREYRVMEEGLTGRTTAKDDVLGKYRNGAKYLGFCLTTDKPVDLLILMLGSNDTKKHLRMTTADIARGIEKLVRIARSGEYGPIENPAAPGPGGDPVPPRILIVAPARLREEVLSSWFRADFDQNAIQKSYELADAYYRVARRLGCYYMNASVYIEAGSVDGLHLDAENHKKLAMAIHAKVLEIFQESEAE